MTSRSHRKRYRSITSVPEDFFDAWPSHRKEREVIILSS